MAASNHTMEMVVGVLLKHIDIDTLDKVFDELREVEGNRSFEETIVRISQKIKQ